ncbi:MAG: hypothetical protein FWB75_09815, partial [Oscillospiraceae bacterium]|nr:hypothetical protein [Oscillospiraceae bacterium]
MQRIKFRKGLALLLAFIMAFTMVMPAVASDYTPEAPAATDVSSGENVGENHGYADTEDGNEENAIEDGHVQGYCGEYDCACIEDDQYALFYISQENIEALDIVEPTPNFEALLPLLGAGDAADWTYHFGTGFPAGDVWNFVPLALGTLNANTLAEEIAGTAWNNFLQVDVPNQGGRRYTHANLPTPIADAHQAFVTFDLRPGNATPGGGVARNFVDHALMIGDNPFLVIRNQQGRMIASGEVPVAGNYWDGELTSYTVLSSITENRADWRNTWFTFGIVLNFISGEAVISVIERGAFDGVAWTYGAVLGTYTVPIAGSSFDGFRIRTQRDSGNNITFTGHGFDNLHFFSGEMPVEWEQIGQTIDFADGIPGAVTNSQIVYTQQFAGQTVLNANPMATYPAATWGNSTGQWALPLTSGAWDIGDNNMVRIEFDFWTEWNRQHTLGWEARFNFDDGTTPFAGTLFGVRGTSNGSHPAGPNQNTHLRIVTSENDQANNTRHSAADIIRSG